MTTPPKWVAELVERVCADRPDRPTVEWLPRAQTPAGLETRHTSYHVRGKRYDPRTEFSGGEQDGEIVRIWHGSLRMDQRSALLHELAHWLTREWHTRRFWDTAWVLYLKYMPRSIPYVLEREARYKTGALRAAVRAGILTAQEAANSPALRRDVSLGG